MGDRETTRTVYDATADHYAQAVGTEISDAFEAPLDRELLALFVDELGSAPGIVADLGTGVGRVAALLTRAGRDDVIGIDLSPQMLRVARRAHPAVRLAAAALAALPLRAGSLDGAVCWYSIIHTSAADLEAVVSEIGRVLRPGCPVLFGFQAGAGESIERANAYGTDFTLTSYRHDPATLVAILRRRGFTVRREAVRPAALPHESSPQGFVLARFGSPDS